MPFKHVRLYDASTLRKMGVVGNGAGRWLQENNIDVPAEVFGICSPRTETDCIVARLPFNEFFIEDCPEGQTVASLLSVSTEGKDCHAYLRQDASFVLSGTEVMTLMSQTCGIDLARICDKMVMTRVADVNAMLLWRPTTGVLRLWCMPGFAAYLWETLLEIARELGGGADMRD